MCDLDLSHNSLGSAGGLAIFEALKANPVQSLRCLKLVSCKLSSVQLGACMGKVLGAGEALCMLRELDIGWNDFDDAAMQVQEVTASLSSRQARRLVNFSPCLDAVFVLLLSEHANTFCRTSSKAWSATSSCKL